MITWLSPITSVCQTSKKSSKLLRLKTQLERTNDLSHISVSLCNNKQASSFEQENTQKRSFKKSLSLSKSQHSHTHSYTLTHPLSHTHTHTVTHSFLPPYFTPLSLLLIGDSKFCFTREKRDERKSQREIKKQKKKEKKEV